MRTWTRTAARCTAKGKKRPTRGRSCSVPWHSSVRAPPPTRPSLSPVLCKPNLPASVLVPQRVTPSHRPHGDRDGGLWHLLLDCRQRARQKPRPAPPQPGRAGDHGQGWQIRRGCCHRSLHRLHNPLRPGGPRPRGCWRRHHGHVRCSRRTQGLCCLCTWGGRLPRL